MTAQSAWRKKFTTTCNVAFSKIPCERDAYHLSNPLVPDYGVVVSLGVE
jgi:hypothetical protein